MERKEFRKKKQNCPHISAYTEEGLRGMGEKCVGDVERFVNGEAPVNAKTKLA